MLTDAAHHPPRVFVIADLEAPWGQCLNTDLAVAAVRAVFRGSSPQGQESVASDCIVKSQALAELYDDNPQVVSCSTTFGGSRRSGLARTLQGSDSVPTGDLGLCDGNFLRAIAIAHLARSGLH